jgi:hypothetical protein
MVVDLSSALAVRADAPWKTFRIHQLANEPGKVQMETQGSEPIVMFPRWGSK